jgi:hypothetical protein
VPALFAHPRHDGATREKHAEHVHVHHLPPLLYRDLGEGAHRERRVEAGVVDEDVDPTTLVDGLLDHPLDVGLVGDVSGQADAAVERARRYFCVLEVGDDDSRALRRQAVGDCIADSLRGAGHDRDLALERVAHRIGEKAVGTRIRFCWVWIKG